MHAYISNNAEVLLQKCKTEEKLHNKLTRLIPDTVRDKIKEI